MFTLTIILQVDPPITSTNDHPSSGADKLSLKSVIETRRDLMETVQFNDVGTDYRNRKKDKSPPR